MLFSHVFWKNFSFIFENIKNLCKYFAFYGDDFKWNWIFAVSHNFHWRSESIWHSLSPSSVLKLNVSLELWIKNRYKKLYYNNNNNNSVLPWHLLLNGWWPAMLVGLVLPAAVRQRHLSCAKRSFKKRAHKYWIVNPLDGLSQGKI